MKKPKNKNKKKLVILSNRSLEKSITFNKLNSMKGNNFFVVCEDCKDNVLKAMKEGYDNQWIIEVQRACPVDLAMVSQKMMGVPNLFDTCQNCESKPPNFVITTMWYK